MQIEIWRDIIGYEGHYQVSNWGRVLSLKSDKVLNMTDDTHGYWKVNLSKNGIRKTHKVHRLVAIHFIPNEHNKNHVNHIDSNPINNHYTNLEWVNKRENAAHYGLTINKSSKYTGVRRKKGRNRYEVNIRHNGKKIYLGCFMTEEEGRDRYIQYMKEHGIVNKYA